MCVLLCSHTSVVSFQVVRKMAQLARRWMIGLSTFLKSSILPRGIARERVFGYPLTPLVAKEMEEEERAIEEN